MRLIGILFTALALTVQSSAFAMPDMSEVWIDVYHQEYDEAKTGIWNVGLAGGFTTEESLHIHLMKMFIALEENNLNDLQESTSNIRTLVRMKYAPAQEE